MYEPFFGMERLPFSAMPDSGCFFCSSEIQSILDELAVCVERGQGIGILTGSAGLGKTLLCQRLASSLQERGESSSRFECVYLGNSNYPTRRSLLQAILFELGDDYSRRDESELRIDLRSRLLSLRPKRDALVLIVDEAHLFADELLEELRTLSDLAFDGSSLVRIILSGQHELEERLTGRVFDALNQRISKHVYAEPLTVSESIEYIAHRLEWAGCDIETVFTEEAVSVIARASGGVPRCLNQLADHSLLLAFASDQKPVPEDTVREALEDLKQLPLHWNDISDGTDVVGFVEDDAADEVGDLPRSSEPDADESASAGSVESDAGNVFEKQTQCLSGIVESLRGPHRSPEHDASRSSVPPLDGGIELDFSHGDSVSTADDSSVDRHDEENHDDTTAPAERVETGSSDVAVFEFAASELEDDHESADVSDSACEPDCPDPDETQIQVLKPAVQETLFEQAIDREVNAADDAAADQGISFQITAAGLELDDFGPPDEITEPVDESSRDVEAAVEQSEVDHAPDQADSSVIEFAFDQKVPDETSPADDAPVETVETPTDTHQTVSVAEISASLLQNDPEKTEADDGVPVVDVTPEEAGDGEQDSEPPNAEAESASPLTASALPEPHDVETSADIPNLREHLSVEASLELESDKPDGELNTDQHEQKEAVVIDAALSDGIDYEEELVFDPYAAMQEPESAGIVWNVTGFGKHSESQPAAEHAEASKQSTAGGPTSEHLDHDRSHADPESTDEDEAFSSSDRRNDSVASANERLDDSTNERQDDPVTSDSRESTIAEDESVPEVDEHQNHETTDHRLILSDGELEFEEPGVDVEATHVREVESHEEAVITDEDVVGAEANSAATEPSEADRAVDDTQLVRDGEVINEVDHDVEEPQEEFREQNVDPSETDYGLPLASDDSLSEERNASNEHDVVQPVEVASPHPGQIVDSIIPLLDELEDGLESVDVPGRADRSVLEIEAELIQSIEHDSDDFEDQIGAAMLDICLDTQSALQDSAAAIRNAEAAGDEAAEGDQNKWSEPQDDALTDSLDSVAPLDVVQPEPRRSDKSSSYRLESHTQEPANGTSLPDASEHPPAETRQPFGRLFSELRRRQR